MNPNAILSEMGAKHGVTPLYACYFGSTLYGTEIPGKSDIDIKGLFIPAKKDALLGKAPHHLRYSSGNDRSRNQASDIDVDLWSISYWLLDLLPSGDTGAVDLLFSPSNSKCVIFKDPLLDDVFENPLDFVNFRGQKGYAGYALGQAKKYGIKGSRLFIVKEVKEWLESFKWDKKDRLAFYFDDLVSKLADNKFLAEVEANNERAVRICGKTHTASTPMWEFEKRILDHYSRYGDRAEAAMRGQGVDWKALSHAVRALRQIIELSETGKIHYPLACADELLEIKKGELSFQKVSEIIIALLEQCDAAFLKTDFNMENAENIILKAYGETE